MTMLGCPFCFDGTDTLLAEGTRAGALVLALVALAVLSGFARFAWRIVKAERES